MRRIRRQRAIKVGKPVDVSLKPLTWNSAQRKELSDLYRRQHDNQKHRIVTPNRVSVVVALGLHLVALLFGTFYVVAPTRLDAEATIVEIVHSIPTHPRRVQQQICDLGGDNHRPLPPNGAEDPFEWKGCPTLPEPTRSDAFVPLEVTRRPAWLKKIEPKYPSHAEKEGRVVLEATIDVDGKAKDIKIKEDDVGFGCARAAIDALEASLFSPAKRGDEIIPFGIAIPYQFKLED